MIRYLLATFLTLIAVHACAGSGTAEVILTSDEIRKVLRHGPWPPEAAPDPSNRASGDPRGIELGERLFSDPALSRNGDMTCATCHQADLNFADGLPRAQGRVRLDRNTLALWNMRSFRWFGWSGDTDNLWAQSLTPILNSDEMAHSVESLRRAIETGPYKAALEDIFGSIEEHEAMETVVHVGKALAAYIETLETGKTSFARFRDALERRDLERASQYPANAQRGLRIFIGEGRCAFCHSGPSFTNSEFHDAGVPYFLEPGRVDPGRSAGLEALEQSPFTLAGDFSDDPDKSGAWAVRSVRFSHSNFGIFRVPTLRRVAGTAPYMHDGSLPDLKSVVEHYNQIDTERLHADGEVILRPIGLTEDEIADLVAFLETLSDDVTEPVAHPH